VLAFKVIRPAWLVWTCVAAGALGPALLAIAASLQANTTVGIHRGGS